MKADMCCGKLLRPILQGIGYLLFLTIILCIPATAQIDTLNYIKGTFFGGPTNDSYLLSVAVDGQGNVYGTGLCTNIPTTVGVYSRTNAGAYDIMVFKLNPTMTQLVWATYIGGSFNEAGGSIAVNSAGEVFVSGYTNSSNFPITINADVTYLSSNALSYFVLKLSSDGSRILYSRILGNGVIVTQQTENAGKGASLAINPQGEAFVFAHTINTVPYRITGNAYQNIMSGTSDLVLSKVDASGNILYSSYFGGSQAETAGNICYANGKIFMTGTTTSANFPLNAGKTPDAGGDCFVLVADDGATPTFRRSYAYGSSSADVGIAIAYDANASRVCMTGTVLNSNFPYTNVLQAGQTTGGFVAAMDDGLTRFDYAVMLGTGVVPTSVVARRNSYVYIAGYTSAGVPLTPNAFQSVRNGRLDGLLISIDSAGRALRYGTYIGGSENDYAVAKVVIFEQPCELRVIFGITTHSQNYPTTASAYQQQKLNGTDDQAALSMFAIPTIKEELTETFKPCADYTFKHLPPPCRVPVEYIWNFGDGSPVVKGASPQSHSYPRNGTYTLVVSVVYPDADTIRLVRAINVNSYPAIKAEPSVTTLCVGDSSVQLHATGGVRYSWYPATNMDDSTSANPRVSPKQTTKYYVRGWDANGCESTAEVLVNVVKITARAERDTIICHGQIIQLRATGGQQVRWTPSEGLNRADIPIVTASPKQTTTYRVLVSDGICYDSASVTVTVVQKPGIVMIPSPTICLSGSAELGATLTAQNALDTTGVQYKWSPNADITGASTANPVVNPTATRWYRLTVTNKYGCTATDSVLVRVENSLTLRAVKDTGICPGSSVRLAVGGASTYEWSPAEGLDNPTKANPLCTPTRDMTYTVIGRSGLCADSIQVRVHLYPVAAVKGLGDTTVCQGERIRLWVEKPETGMSYSWSPPEDFENPNGAEVYAHPKRTTNYVVTVTNAQNCSLYDTVHVSTENALVVSAGADVSACEGETVVLNVSSANDANTVYTWMPNDGVYNAQTREYTVKATATKVYAVQAQRGSCSGADSVLLTVRPMPQFSISADTNICEGNVVQLQAISTQQGISYRWLRNNALDALLNDANSASPRTIALDKQTSFSVEATLNGCTVSKTMTVYVHSKPQLLTPAEPDICPGVPTRIKLTVQGLRSISWSPATALSSTTEAEVIASPMQTITYTINATDTNGCSNSTQFTIHVKERPDVSFSLSSLLNMEIDQDTAIIVYASAEKALTTPIELDVVCNRGIFEPVEDISRIDGERRFMHIRIPSQALDQTQREIARIKGHTYLTMPYSSTITVENASLDEAQCLDTISSPGLITTTACFMQGRNITVASLLTALIAPNPIEEHSVLQLHAEAKSPVSISLIDELAREVGHWEFEQPAENSELPLQLTALPSGVYTLLVRAGWQQTTLRVVKSR